MFLSKVIDIFNIRYSKGVISYICVIKTPARIALNEAIKPRKNKIGRPKTSWLDIVQKDCNELKIDINIKEIMRGQNPEVLAIYDDDDAVPRTFA